MGISIISAVSENNVIGNKGKIPWHIKEDFKIFKELTLNNVIIMGRKTWVSLPKRPLPNRINIVVGQKEITDNVEYFKSLNEAIEHSKKNYPEKEVFLIGGHGIYREGLEIANTMYLSHVFAEFKGDTFFPEYDKDKWKVVEEKEYEPFIFKKYERI